MRRPTPPTLHPRQRQAHDLVRSRPGLCFRELHRRLGWPLGSLQRHLARLVGEGLVVAHPHRNTVRYFAAGSPCAAAWRQAVALADPDARRLHEWVLAHPRMRQAELGAVTREWGWTRARTRRRLAALAEAGLVSWERAGTACLYRATPPSEGIPLEP